jgi:4-hydroxyphenylacetate 3-monooxygenase
MGEKSIQKKVAMGTGLPDQFKGFAEQCMSEYDLNGWLVPDLTNPDDVNLFANS